MLPTRNMHLEGFRNSYGFAGEDESAHVEFWMCREQTTVRNRERTTVRSREQTTVRNSRMGELYMSSDQGDCVPKRQLHILTPTQMKRTTIVIGHGNLQKKVL